MITVGQHIGCYEVLQHLGQGGVGDVFAGVDRMLNRPVAIKALRSEFSREAGFVARFRAEAENLARLNHPNITTLYSLHREGDALFMIMELVHGRTLDELAHAAGQLNERESLALIAQAVEGLNYAHRIGVVHRDVKPANMMVTGEGLLKIMDFGIARMRGTQRLTREGHIVGTLAYMAPEQIRGLVADERTDVYSLAIVLYELLFGNTPFVSDSDYELLKLQVEAVPPRLIDRVPGISPGLEGAILHALAKDPAERFQTMAEFGRGLGIFGMKAEAIEVIRTRFSGLVGETTVDRGAAQAEGPRPRRSSGTRQSPPPDRIGDRATRLASNPDHLSRISAATEEPSRARDVIGGLGGPLAVLATVGMLLASGLTYVVYELLQRPASITAGSSTEASPPVLETTEDVPGDMSRSDAAEAKHASESGAPEEKTTKDQDVGRAESQPSSDTPAVVPSPILPPPPLLEEGRPPPPKFADQAPKKTPRTRSRPSQSQTPKKAPLEAPLDPSAGGKGWVIDRGK